MVDSDDEDKQTAHQRPKCFLDIAYAGSEGSRVLIELFDDVTPATAENFRRLCVGDFTGKEGKKLHYKGCYFHRVVQDFMIQGGDITKNNGTGGESIYGPDFKDENFLIRHTVPGLLSMANAGKHTNSSQFFITVKATPWLDGKHVVFGRVIEGMDLVMALNRVSTRNDKPTQPIVIKDCGEVMDAKQAEELKKKVEEEERDKDKTEMQKSHDRVRAARAKIEKDAKEVCEDVTDAVQQGIKRSSEADKAPGQPKKPRLAGGMFAGLEGDDSEDSEDE